MLTATIVRDLTMCHSYAALVLDTGATTVSNTGAILFSIGGKTYSKGAMTNAASPTTDGKTGAAFVALAASEGCALVFCLNAAGTLQIIQGETGGIDTSGDYIDSDINSIQWPYIPDTSCPFAYTLVKNSAAGSAWTAGTSNWNATGITATVVNIATLPARPEQ